MNIGLILLYSALCFLSFCYADVKLSFGPPSIQKTENNVEKPQNIKLSSPKHIIDLGRLTEKTEREVKKTESQDNWAPSRNEHDYSRMQGHTNNQSPRSTSLTLEPEISDQLNFRLSRLLGARFDSEWTSIEEPRMQHQTGHVVSSGKNDLFNAARDLNITLKDHNGKLSTLGDQQVDQFRSWLVEMATCEMEFIWEDLGNLFWPRYIKRGVCVNKPEKFCSWPPGMKCRPSGSRALQLLRWKCEENSQEAEFRKRSIQYPNFQNRYKRQADNDMDYLTLQRRSRNGRSPEYRKQRLNRLIRRTSKYENGKFCKWNIQKIVISDSCTCSCS